MRILALLPDIHRLPTGGNLFNRHALEYLDRVATVERRVVTDLTPSEPEHAGVILIDSLLLPMAGDLLRDPAGRRVLLAHYLHIFDPERTDSSAAERERRLLPQLDGVVTTSEFCRDLLLDEGFTEQQLAAVTPGLAPGYASEVGARSRAATRILTVSTLLPGKGLRQLLDVLESLADLEWTWEIAGDPGLDPAFRDDFCRRVERSPIADRVRLLGAVDPERMVALYDRCDLFALPSRFETCSMATMEAMARGMPVVAYRTGGLPERVPAATSDLLAAPGNHEQFGGMVRSLLENPDRAAAVGRENRRASRAFPTWEQSGSSLWEFLRRREAPS